MHWQKNLPKNKMVQFKYAYNKTKWKRKERDGGCERTRAIMPYYDNSLFKRAHKIWKSETLSVFKDDFYHWGSLISLVFFFFILFCVPFVSSNVRKRKMWTIWVRYAHSLLTFWAKSEKKYKFLIIVKFIFSFRVFQLCCLSYWLWSCATAQQVLMSCPINGPISNAIRSKAATASAVSEMKRKMEKRMRESERRVENQHRKN